MVCLYFMVIYASGEWKSIEIFCPGRRMNRNHWVLGVSGCTGVRESIQTSYDSCAWNVLKFFLGYCCRTRSTFDELEEITYLDTSVSRYIFE